MNLFVFNWKANRRPIIILFDTSVGKGMLNKKNIRLKILYFQYSCTGKIGLQDKRFCHSYSKQNMNCKKYRQGETKIRRIQTYQYNNKRRRKSIKKWELLCTRIHNGGLKNIRNNNAFYKFSLMLIFMKSLIPQILYPKRLHFRQYNNLLVNQYLSLLIT